MRGACVLPVLCEYSQHLAVGVARLSTRFAWNALKPNASRGLLGRVRKKAMRPRKGPALPYFVGHELVHKNPPAKAIGQLALDNFTEGEFFDFKVKGWSQAKTALWM